MLSTYKGPTQTFTNIIGNDVYVENDKEYDIQVEMQGPQVTVNGIRQIHPDSIFWVIINNSKMPYTHECLKKHWTGFDNV